MIRHLPRLGVLLALSTALLAQNCPERNLGIALGSGDDVMFPIQPIGFTFPFAGATYTDVHVCTNGFVNLSNAGLPAPGAADYTATAAELVGGSPRICALWTDLFMVAASGGACHINSSATRCSITWDQATNYGSPSEFQIQMQLFPNGDIKIYYSAGTVNASTFSQAAANGIVGVSPGQGAVLPTASNLSVTGGTASPTMFEFFAGGTFDMPALNLDFVSAPPGWANLPSALTNCADTANYGSGCIQANDSFYQMMTPPAFDMANRVLTMLRQANGYLVIDSLPGAIVPTGAGSYQVAIGDDVVQTVPLTTAMPVAGGGTTSALTICSNAHIALSPNSNGASVLPTIPTFLGWANTVVGAIHDYDQTAPGSGLIKFEEAGGFAYVTWDNVISWNTAVADTLQFQFNMTTGDITIVFGAYNPGGNNYLIGYSVGGPSPDPGTTDVSTAFATPTLITDVPVGPGLALTGTGLPVLGTNFTYAIANVPNVAPIAILFFGDTALPGLDLSFLGAPNCRAYTNGNLASFSVPIALPAGTGTQALAIPPGPSLAGIQVTSQAAAFTLANPLNLVFSNGTSI
ncbi:MAG: hypothetical protein WAT39_26630, partial [Planctomycetota bacterium]